MLPLSFTFRNSPEGATPFRHPLQARPPATIAPVYILQYHEVMNFETWLDDLIQPDSRRTAAGKADYSQSTLSRQLDRGYLRPEMVIALCRAYGRSPVAGLVETGYIESYETEGVSVPFALEQATNRQILDEIMRRSDPEARHLFGADEDTIGLADDAEVFELPNRNVRPVSDDEVPFDAVADSSPEEGDGDPGSYEP